MRLKNSVYGGTVFPYKRRVFHQFLASYMLIMIIPLLIGMVSVSRMLDITVQSEHEKNQLLLNRCAMEMGQVLDSVDAMMNRVMFGSAFSSLSAMRSPHEDAWAIAKSRALRDEVQSAFNGHTHLAEFLVYLRDPGILCTGSGAVFFDADRYYGDFLRLSDMDKSSWLTLLKEKGHTRFLPEQRMLVAKYSNDANERSVVPYVRPAMVGGKFVGNMVALLRVQSFYTAVRGSLRPSTGSAAWVRDAAGQIVMAYPFGFDPDANLEGMIVTSTTPRTNGLTYHSAVPRSEVLAPVTGFIHLLAACLLLAVGVGLSLSLLFASRQGKPLDNIARNLSMLYAPQAAAARHGAGIRYLNDSINALIKSHGQLEEYLNIQGTVAERMFYEKLLAGLFKDEQQIVTMMQQLGLPIIEGQKALFVLRISAREEVTLDDTSAASARLAAATQRWLPEVYYQFEADMSTTVFLMANGHQEERARQLVDELNGSLPPMLGLGAHCAVSESFDEYMQAGQAYVRCIEVVHRANAEQPVLLVHDESGPMSFDYSLEEESRLMSFALAGNSDRVREILERVYNENLVHAEHRHAPVRLMLDVMLGTLLRVRGMLHRGESGQDSQWMDTCLARIDAAPGPKDAFQVLEAEFAALCEMAQGQKLSKTQRLAADVKLAIERDYADHDLGLAALARRFDVTEAHLSRAFKEFTGGNLSAYIEKVRVERAIELMKGADTLEQIANAVGFDHQYGFRNAFKRIIGPTPSEYRKRETA